jgi:hypothetical protein
MTDKSGKTYNAAGLPISNFNSAQKVNVVFNNVPPCLNFSSVNITTDCSRATKIYTKARCPTETKAIVRIDNVTYDNEIATAFLKNIGSGSIDSNSIRILIDGKTVECKKSFTLSAKTTERCDINFVCSNEKAKFEIAEPGNDTKEFSCIKPINITVESCKDPTCKETSASFGTGENIYIKATTDPKADVKAILYEGTSNRSIDITQPIKLKEPGTYTIALVASKEGYQETIQNIQLTVAKSSNTGTIINFLLIGGLIVLIAGFIYYRLKKTKKKAGFDELYEKYKDKQKYDALYKKYKKVRRR